MIDDSPLAYRDNAENALPIKPWHYTHRDDRSLLDLLPKIANLRFVSDIRTELEKMKVQ